MKLTVLIDLDDTLISNDMDTFLKVYLKALGAALTPFVPPEKMIPQLLSATGMMTGKTSPLLTLEEEFDRHFYPALGYKKSELEPPLLDFYNNEFSKFKFVTEKRATAVNLVENILARDWDVVIATNPLFPQTAVFQRAQWAGLDDYIPKIKFITSFESFHFAKPNPAYYAEILGRLGWPEQPAVMIGNSLSDDILPASKLGLPVYWLNQNHTLPPPGLDGRVKCGDLDGVFPWLESIAAKGSAPEIVEPESLKATLTATAAAFDTLCRQMEASTWKTRPDSNDWSPTEILCHMRDVDREVNLIRLPLLLSESNPFLPAVDTDLWADERRYQTQDGKEALTLFIQNRVTLLNLIEKLDAGDWDLPARHAIFGPITLKELVAIIASHDRAHLNQLVCTINPS